MAKSVSSAVVAVADVVEESRSPGANGLKRRQSESSEQESNKRQRTSPGKNSPEVATEGEQQPKEEPESNSKPVQKEDDRQSRRKSGVADEKQRSKRLFGALLGNLNQPGDRASKRRSEIEQRRKAELQKQDDERLEDRQKRLEKLTFQRKKDQIRVDEQNMQIRHRNLLDAANFLQTRTEPKLYYRPWDLLPDEEDRVDDQLKEAQTQIDQEVGEFEEQKRRRLEELHGPEEKPADSVQGDEAAPTDKQPKEESIEADKDVVKEEQHPTDLEDPPKESHDNEIEKEASKDANRSEPRETTASETVEVKDEAKDEAEDEGDHIVEGDEDTVIY